MPPTITQIAEVALIVQDLDRSRRFYRAVLGLAAHHFPNLRQAFAEFARVLKAGGILGFADKITVPNKQAAGYYNALLSRLKSRLPQTDSTSPASSANRA